MLALHQSIPFNVLTTPFCTSFTTLHCKVLVQVVLSMSFVYPWYQIKPGTLWPSSSLLNFFICFSQSEHNRRFCHHVWPGLPWLFESLPFWISKRHLFSFYCLSLMSFVVFAHCPSSMAFTSLVIRSLSISTPAWHDAGHWGIVRSPHDDLWPLTAAFRPRRMEQFTVQTPAFPEADVKQQSLNCEDASDMLQICWIPMWKSLEVHLSLTPSQHCEQKRPYRCWGPETWRCYGATMCGAVLASSTRSNLPWKSPINVSTFRSGCLRIRRYKKI